MLTQVQQEKLLEALFNPKLKSDSGRVYFLQGELTRRTKVGKTTQLTTRVRSLQASSPDTLECVHIIKGRDCSQTEKFFHKWLASYRHHDEWFEIPEALLSIIKTILTAKSIEKTFEKEWLNTPVKKIRTEMV